jgi:hypothetical protein
MLTEKGIRPLFAVGLESLAMRKLSLFLAGTALLAVSGALIEAQAGKIYKTRLSPVAVQAFNPAIVGIGTVTATLTGTRLAISGTFEGLNTPATIAQIHKSPKAGIRGPVLLELTVTKGAGGGTSGSIGGSFDLTPAQVQELAQGRYYVQLHSEKAPEGNLWGWLMEPKK